MKLVSRDELLGWRERQSGRLVFTNGVFEVIHPGHVEYLEAARAMGDALVVAVNSDDSARRLAKGPGRPTVPADARARLLAALERVDRVTIFEEDTPLALIQLIRPDVLVKGGNYTRDTIVGADFVESYGGTVQIIPLVNGYSTTGLLERIRASS